MTVAGITLTASQIQATLWFLSLIAAGLLGWLVARYLGTRAVLSWECRQIEIGSPASDDGLQLVHNGRPVERACVAAIRLVNTGSQMIREEPDIGSPLTIHAPHGCRLLRARPVEQTCEGVGAECRQVSQAAAEVHYRALRPGEQMLIEVVHDGSADDEPTVRGQLADAALRRPRPVGDRLLMGLAAIAMLLAVIYGGADLFLYWQSPGPDNWHHLWFGLAMLAGAVLALAGLVHLARREA